MSDSLWLVLAFVCSVAGMAWLALAMKAHWQQVCGGEGPAKPMALTLRVLGSVALLLSLRLYLTVDHGSMASLVWVMSLAASALIVAMMLTWRPRWLGILAVPFARRA